MTEQYTLQEMQEQKRLEYRKLLEVSSLTQELAQAVERRDQVSVQMVLSMRQEPVEQLREMQNQIQTRLLSYPEAEAVRIQALLNGETAAVPEEEPLCRQVEQNRILLEKIVALDRLISLRLGGSRSFYRKYREET